MDDKDIIRTQCDQIRNIDSNNKNNYITSVPKGCEELNILLYKD